MKIGFWGMLCILFIALKLMGYITWSWLIVLFPFTISAVLILVLLVMYFIQWFVRAYG
jgi:hypothetical protein